MEISLKYVIDKITREHKLR